MAYPQLTTSYHVVNPFKCGGLWYLVVRSSHRMENKRTAPRTRLGLAMEQRATELQLNWQELHRRTGVPISSINAYRSGDRNPGRVSAHKLEQGLHWKSGSIARIQDGGEPEVDGEAMQAHAQELTREQIKEMTREALRGIYGREPTQVEVTQALMQAARDE